MENEINESKKNRFGMVLLEKNKRMPIESLKLNRHYQRATEAARMEKVKNGILTCGHFLPEKSITVNQNNEVVDGQHRLWAAKKLEYTHIPVAKYYFEDKEREAAFFVYINGFDERLNPIDYWYGMFLAGDPLANVIYKLEDHPKSALKNKIVVKGKNTNFKIGHMHTLEIIGLAIGVNNHWTKAAHHLWLRRLSIVPFDETLFNINSFIKWYESIFGDKKTAPWAYYKDSFRAIKYFYVILKKEGWQNKKDTIVKMKSFKLDVTFMTAPSAGKKYQLIDHFNKNRQKQRLPYNIE